MQEFHVNVFLGTYVVFAEDEDGAEDQGYSLCLDEWGESIAHNVVYVVEEN